MWERKLVYKKMKKQQTSLVYLHQQVRNILNAAVRDGPISSTRKISAAGSSVFKHSYKAVSLYL